MKSIIVGLLAAVLGVFYWSCSTEDKPKIPTNNEVVSPSLNTQGLWKVVGEVVNGNPELTLDKSETIETLRANLLLFSGIDAEFNDIIIRDMSDGIYSLMFVGDEYVTSFHARNTNSVIGIEAMTGTSCTTTECSSELLGCVVKYEGDLAYCSPCSNGGVCTKTSTSSAMF